MERLGLIAGNGRFPVIFAETARAAGISVVAVAHEGETLSELSGLVDSITWIKVGELGRMIQTFQTHGVTRAVMAGGIRKAALMEHFAPDERAMRFLARLTTFSDDILLRGIADELQSDGIQIVDSLPFLSSIATPAGVLSPRAPSDQQWRDIRLGFDVAKGVGRFDVGQSVVVKSGVVLAVEAIEGTDATMRRGGALGNGEAVLVKVSKPGQDLRFDVPAVGLATVQVAKEVGIAVIALEAGRTLMLDQREFLADAHAADLIVVGVTPAQ
ncbi:MAG TPA: UDP-2,3-diacylglucosamine diphosphatase LpxI [Candidatus Binatia bacterium]|nr:UDP-2,3-diacylglucosamine diphosphatase LpxI [Candidatus Binatia bacterium]